MHTMVGSEAAANARFQNATQQASSTYGVKLDGSVVQWVKEADTAWANGTYYDNPGANVDSISIEHEDNGDYNGPRTPALYEASAKLVADICSRHGIPIDRAHIIKHKECFQAATACPDSLNVDGIVARALVLAGLHGGSTGSVTGDEMFDPNDPVVKHIEAIYLAVGDGGKQTLWESLKGAFTANSTKADIAALQKSVDVLSGRSAGALTPQQAADLATVAALARKLGLP